jgi:histone-lysine N-methyltransferase SETMAR
VVSKIFRAGDAICTAVVVGEAPVPTGQTVNDGFYRDVLRRLRENVRRRRPELWREHNWLLHHYNPPSHTSALTQKFLAEDKMAVIPQPPYSPDLAP